MMFIRFPLSLRDVEDLLHEREIDITHETVRFWWNRCGPMFAARIRKRRVLRHRHSSWSWHLDEAFVKIKAEPHDLWRAVDHEGEVLLTFRALTIFELLRAGIIGSIIKFSGECPAFFDPMRGSNGTSLSPEFRLVAVIRDRFTFV